MDFGNHEFQLQNNGLSQLGTASPDGNCRKTGYVQTQTIRFLSANLFDREVSSHALLRLFVDTMWTQIETGSARKLQQVVGDGFESWMAGLGAML